MANARRDTGASGNHLAASATAGGDRHHFLLHLPKSWRLGLAQEFFHRDCTVVVSAVRWPQPKWRDVWRNRWLHTDFRSSASVITRSATGAPIQTLKQLVDGVAGGVQAWDVNLF
jgi:hypothetical protein